MTTLFEKKANSRGHAGRGGQSRRGRYRRDAGVGRGECSGSGCMDKHC